MSLPTKNTLKFSYRGQKRNILYDVLSKFKDIIAIVMKEFNISKEHIASLLIEDENGYLFDRNTFDYFILLFPNPEIVFFLRIDENSQLRSQYTGCLIRNKKRSLNTRDNQRCSLLSMQSSFFDSEKDDSPKPLVKRRKLIDSKKPSKKLLLKSCGGKNSTEGTPVFRQDCFLGSLPDPYFNQPQQRNNYFNPTARQQNSNYARKANNQLATFCGIKKFSR